MNAMLIDLARRGQSRDVLVAPVTTSTVGASGMATLALGEHWDGAPLEVDALVASLRRRVEDVGLPVRRDGVEVTDDALDDVLGDAARHLIDTAPGYWRRLGIERPPGRSSSRPGRRRR